MACALPKGTYIRAIRVKTFEEVLHTVSMSDFIKSQGAGRLCGSMLYNKQFRRFTSNQHMRLIRAAFPDENSMLDAHTHFMRVEGYRPEDYHHWVTNKELVITLPIHEGTDNDTSGVSMYDP